MNAIKFVLSDTAILWWNTVLGSGNAPVTLDNLQQLFNAKFKIAKSRQELKHDLAECKYVLGVSSLPMINKFQQICDKLNLALEIQIEKFIRILPANLRQFVVPRNTDGFDEVKYQSKHTRTCLKWILYQLFLKVCHLRTAYVPCDHKSFKCPSLKYIIEMEINSGTYTKDDCSEHQSRARSSTRHDCWRDDR